MRRPPSLLFSPLYFASRPPARPSCVAWSWQTTPFLRHSPLASISCGIATRPTPNYSRIIGEEGGPVGPANAAADYVKQQSSQHAVIFWYSPIPHSLSSRSSSGVYYCLKDANKFQEVSACRKVRVIVVTESRFPGPPPRDKMGEKAGRCDAVD